jgi:protein-S-isoprenylcysteine O-methyltransferase Ste14
VSERTGSGPGRPLIVRVIGGTLGTTMFVAGVFWAAGRVDWGRGWIYTALLVVTQSIGGMFLWRHDPELIRRRSQPGEGTARWDMALLGLFGLGYAGAVVVAALDAARFGWSDVPSLTWPLGAALYLAGMSVVIWAMAVNTHFEKTVRIQHDRAHRVIDGGPYRLVRHPGYVGASLCFPLAAPLLLGSWWAFLPAVFSVAALTLRTALEDRLLRRELDGYAEYATRVRFRLIPGVW